MPDQSAEFQGEATLSQKVLRAKTCPKCATSNAWDAEACAECGADLSDVHGPVVDRGIVSRGNF